MRKVKYNFWDVHKKKMITWDMFKDGLFSRDKLYEGYLYDFIHGVTGNLIPLLWIGLKDYKNREIHDGDFYQTDEIVWEVYFGKNKQDGERSLGWCIRAGNNTYSFDLLMKKGTIIGNRFENPELLKEKGE